MVMMIVILSIMSNTVFSLGYIIVLCAIMFLSSLFYKVESARLYLLPLLQSFVTPYVLVEILAQMIYQMPLEKFNNSSSGGGTSDIVAKIPSIIGVEKYYEVSYLNKAPTLTIDTDTKSLGQLWCKALVYFLIALQIEIIKSKSFERLNDYVSLCNMKGKAVTYRFNNLKIKKYIKYEDMNHHKKT